MEVRRPDDWDDVDVWIGFSESDLKRIFFDGRMEFFLEAVSDFFGWE